MQDNSSTSSPVMTPKPDSAGIYHIYVANLTPDVDERQLRDVFAMFGEIVSCRVDRNERTGASRGQAFVSYGHRMDAENAIATMNGQQIGRRLIRTSLG